MSESELGPMVNRTRPVTSSVKRVRVDHAAWWGGMLASVVLHALVVMLWGGDIIQVEGTSPSRRWSSFVSGGGAIQSIRISFSHSEEMPPPPTPIIEVEIPRVKMREISVSLPGARLLPVRLPARLPGISGGSGSGRDGLGEGGDGEGEQGYEAPVPKSVIPQWDPPESVRGLQVTVYVLVDEQGWPRDVELDPPTPDNGFNRHIVSQVKGWKYRPARRAGQSITGWAEITFIF